MTLPAGLLPAVALLAGVTGGTFTAVEPRALVLALPGLWGAAAWSWWTARAVAAPVLLAFGFAGAGAALAADARAHALQAPLRAVLDTRFGGFAIESIGPAGRHEPVAARVRLHEDASRSGDVVSLRGEVLALRVEDGWAPAAGGVILSVAGTAHDAGAWRAGRVVEAPVTFRRPARYLNDGVPDFERAMALDGTALFGSIKSGLLVEVVARGNRVRETAADAREHVRSAVAAAVSPHSELSSAITTAILIGDRSGLPDEVRDRLQAAGTYHVIAISGGNIAILAALTIGVLRLLGLASRASSIVTMAVLLLYAEIASSGPSVWRATLMAVLYLAARALDHRTAPWHAAAAAAAVMLALRPLDVRDPGFILTFGATVALLESARRAGAASGSRVSVWVLGSLTASCAAEIALLPVAAQTFSRVSSAGLVLNLIAVPMMSLVQIAGLVVALVPFDIVARPAGWVAHLGAAGLVDSARLVDVAPWLTTRVPAPGLVVIALYYAALTAALASRGRARAGAAVALAAAAAVIVTGAAATWGRDTGNGSGPALLRLTMFDVGQGESILVELPDGSALLVDAGGAPFGGGSFDIGERVLAPALWARGLRALDALLVTHGDPDHLGGAPALVRDFSPGAIWWGIPVPPHEPSRELHAQAARAAIPVRGRRAGEEWRAGPSRIRVLHPPEPDWERPRVRNDDSVVIEIVHGDVAILLTGDISTGIERAIIPRLTPAPIRVLKVAHHGSRTSTAQDLLDAWRPHYALISAGRGNTFGHPTAEALRRLEANGAAVFRTDRDGQITFETDGRNSRLSTYLGASYETRRPR